MHQNTWDLPFGDQAELELHSEWGRITILPVEPGQQPRLELTHGSHENVDVHIDKHDTTVRVGLDPRPNFKWFGQQGWECRAVVYVPPNVRAAVQTNAGAVRVRELDGCELGIKANAGKIELGRVRGVLHLSADAGSIHGTEVGGFFNVETQAGSIHLQIVELQPGEHHVRAAMGSVRVQLVPGLDVCIETHTSLGSVRNNYPSRSAAAARLLLSTEMGSLRIDESSFHRNRGWRPAPATRPPADTQAVPPSAPREDPELDRILRMVESGELSAKDADELLQAMGRV